MSFFGLGKSYLYPKYYWDFRTNEPIGALSGAAVPQATFSGSAPAAAAVDPAGETITYSIGAAGAAAAAGADGGLGGSTTMILLGTAMTGSGGGGGYCTAPAIGAGGPATGGMTNTDGGAGRSANVTSDDCGQGGGGIGLAPMGAAGATSTAGNGAQSVDIEGLQAAVVAAGYSWTGPGLGGGQPGNPYVDGAPATGFGCGGGGGNWLATIGGEGYLGGGGGGAGAENVGDMPGIAGGGGSLVIKCTNDAGSSTVVVKTSGTSYSVPAGTVTVEAWAIGAGGGGAGAIDYGGWAGCGGGGGAGGVAYRYWGQDPNASSGDGSGTQDAQINTPWKYPWQKSVPSTNRATGSFAGAVSGALSVPAPYISLSPMTIPTTWTFSGWARMNEKALYPRVFEFNAGIDTSMISFMARSDAAWDAAGGTKASFVYNQNGGTNDDRITCADFFTVGEWFHWAWTCDGSTIKAYKDGALTGSTALTLSQVGRTLPNCSLGYSLWQPATVGTFNQSDFCIHNVALDVVSIENMYSGSVSPTAVSSSNIIQYFSLDPYEYGNLGRGQSFTPYITSSCNTAISASVTGNVFLTSSAGSSFMHIAPSSSAGGYLGNCSLRFDGIDDYAALSPMTFGTEWSISCWARFDSDNNDFNDRIWEFGGPGGWDILALFRATLPNTEVALGYESSGWQGGETSTGIGNIVPGEWFHVVGTYETIGISPFAVGELNVYWNGTLARTDGGLINVFPVGERSVNYLATDLSNHSEASVSDLCIHNAVLDAVSIENLYSGSVSPTAVSSSNIVAYYPLDEGSGKYLRQAYPSAISSSLTGNIINTDCAGWTYNTPFSGAAADANQFYGYSFDGTSNYVTLSEISSSTKWSITGWAKTSLSDTNESARVFEFNNPGGTSTIALLQYGIGAPAGYETEAILYYDDSTGANYEHISFNNFWEADKWVHFAITTDGTNLNLYKNTTLVSGGVMNYSHTAQARNLNHIGADYSESNLWNGGVAELAVWDFDLTDMQVKALYNDGKYTFSNMELEYKQTYLSGSTFVTGNVPQ